VILIVEDEVITVATTATTATMATMATTATMAMVIVQDLDHHPEEDHHHEATVEEDEIVEDHHQEEEIIRDVHVHLRHVMVVATKVVTVEDVTAVAEVQVFHQIVKVEVVPEIENYLHLLNQKMKHHLQELNLMLLLTLVLVQKWMQKWMQKTVPMLMPKLMPKLVTNRQVL